MSSEGTDAITGTVAAAGAFALGLSAHDARILVASYAATLGGLAYKVWSSRDAG